MTVFTDRRMERDRLDITIVHMHMSLLTRMLKSERARREKMRKMGQCERGKQRVREKREREIQSMCEREREREKERQ
uniref:Uncharacterized protein n=1 Tax=Octopus bimaculoides TaxID=37653 RepID=A0A0L8G2B4_OCTBM